MLATMSPSEFIDATPESCAGAGRAQLNRRACLTPAPAAVLVYPWRLQTGFPLSFPRETHQVGASYELYHGCVP